MEKENANLKEAYEAPVIEIVEVRVEREFNQTNPDKPSDWTN